MDIDVLARKARCLPLEEKLIFISSLQRLLIAGGSAPPQIIYQSIQRSEVLGSELPLPNIKLLD